MPCLLSYLECRNFRNQAASEVLWGSNHDFNKNLMFSVYKYIDFDHISTAVLLYNRFESLDLPLRAVAAILPFVKLDLYILCCVYSFMRIITAQVVISLKQLPICLKSLHALTYIYFFLFGDILYYKLSDLDE